MMGSNTKFDNDSFLDRYFTMFGLIAWGTVSATALLIWKLYQGSLGNWPAWMILGSFLWNGAVFLWFTVVRLRGMQAIAKR